MKNNNFNFRRNNVETDPSRVASEIWKELEVAQRILLLTHKEPDGDAIGSVMGLWNILSAIGKQVIPLVTPIESSSLSLPIPEFARSLPGIEHAQVYHSGFSLPDVDLIWIVDTSDLTRLGTLYEEQEQYILNHSIIVVDHHTFKETEVPGKINLIDIYAASCTELLYMLFEAMELPLSPDVAHCLLLGIMTDTQRFQTHSTRPKTHEITAKLLEAGAESTSLIRQIETTPFETAQLLGLSLARMQQEDGGLIWSVVTRDMLHQAGVLDDRSYYALIDFMEQIEGGRIYVVFKEDAPDRIKVSLRSKPDIDLVEIVKKWDGGGRHQAAGVTLNLDIDTAIANVLPELRARLKN